MSQTSPTCLYSGNAAFVEGLYEAWLGDPGSVSSEWGAYFEQMRDKDAGAEIAHGPVRESFEKAARQRKRPVSTATGEDDDRRHTARRETDIQVAVLQLINAYRFRGHRQADLDPLALNERPEVPDLDPGFHGLLARDMDTEFNAGSLFGVEHASLRTILDIIRRTYTGPIGAEYMYLTSTEQKRWIQSQLEHPSSKIGMDDKRKRDILERLVAANALEQYLHMRYVGQKRFSLEGGESLIPMLDALTQRAGGKHGVKEVIIGMAHRGRLNVLVNILGKLPGDLFSEFEGHIEPRNGSGDVKYHQGFSADVETARGPLHQVLSFNPSHLEIINPVVEGSVRARQERRQDKERNLVMPILIHGDAAFSGQGVVMETLNLSETRGYTTGGTVHIVINNQIGFTTSDPLDSRSTLYCTDVAKVVQAPIFHVNGDNPEAVVFVTRVALDYRMQFHKDVVIDMVCYRRHGHSEADEPSATQPIMYQKIAQHPQVHEVYAKQLLDAGIIDQETLATMTRDYLARLESNQPTSRPLAPSKQQPFLIDYRPFRDAHWTEPADTTIEEDHFRHLCERLTDIPAGFRLHPAVARIIDNRRKMAQGLVAIDWGLAESLAYASLVTAGYPVRLCGQDSGRGTFFHRHAILHNQDDGSTWQPLQHIDDQQARFLVINSLLSEEAVLGYELGYSTAEPNSLVIWEAQFGDFANNAQVIIDQFISSSEAKWQRLCGLVMMLPHGYDGQGPEHSSARLERYLQLCAEDNMQVCVPSTPSQMFHMLRRQILRPYRKPLIIMSPKSLLRHKLSTSSMGDLTQRGFQTAIGETDGEIRPEEVTRLLLCAGKVYFEILEGRRQHGIKHIAIARIEQLYPFPQDEVKAIIDSYPNLREVIWVQEEPRNQGAWFFMQTRQHLRACLGPHHYFNYAGRNYSASPAVGYLHLHLQQQRELIEDALQVQPDE